MANQRRSNGNRSSARRNRPVAATRSTGLLSWLKRVRQALSLANAIAFAAVVVALPAGLLAWHQLSDEKPVAAAQVQGADAIKLPNAALPKADTGASGSPSSSTAPTASVIARTAENASAPRTAGVSPSTFDEREAELSRPNLILESASVQDIGLDQVTKWSITIANEGRPANVSVMNTQELSNLEAPKKTLSCSEVEKTGTTVRFGKRTSATLFGGPPLSQSDWDAYIKGIPLMLAATYCFTDDVTHRDYVKHICLKRYLNGQTEGCRKNND